VIVKVGKVIGRYPNRPVANGRSALLTHGGTNRLGSRQTAVRPTSANKSTVANKPIALSKWNGALFDPNSTETEHSVSHRAKFGAVIVTDRTCASAHRRRVANQGWSRATVDSRHQGSSAVITLRRIAPSDRRSSANRVGRASRAYRVRCAGVGARCAPAAHAAAKAGRSARADRPIAAAHRHSAAAEAVAGTAAVEVVAVAEVAVAEAEATATSEVRPQ
jgi:hypothetical protein